MGMEYVEGAPLRGPLPAEEVLRIGRQITAAYKRHITHQATAANVRRRLTLCSGASEGAPFPAENETHPTPIVCALIMSVALRSVPVYAEQSGGAKSGRTRTAGFLEGEPGCRRVAWHPLRQARRRCSPSSLIPSQRRERSILNGLSAAQQFANKVLIALP